MQVCVVQHRIDHGVFDGIEQSTVQFRLCRIFQDLVRDRPVRQVDVAIGVVIREDLCRVLDAVGMIRRLHQSRDLHIDLVCGIPDGQLITDCISVCFGKFLVDPYAFSIFRVKCAPVKYVHSADVVALQEVHFQRHIVPALQISLEGQAPVRGADILVGTDLLHVFFREAFPGQPHVCQVVFVVDLFRAYPHPVHVGMYS